MLAMLFMLPSVSLPVCQPVCTKIKTPWTAEIVVLSTGCSKMDTERKSIIHWLLLNLCTTNTNASGLLLK